MVQGGVCSPQGFSAAGVHCGIKKSQAKDLAMVVSETICSDGVLHPLHPRNRNGPLAAGRIRPEVHPHQ